MSLKKINQKIVVVFVHRMKVSIVQNSIFKKISIYSALLSVPQKESNKMKANEQDCSRCLTPMSDNMLKDREESSSICSNSFLKYSKALGGDAHGGDLRDVRFDRRGSQLLRTV